MGLVSEQNVMNRMGVKINPTAQFQPASHVRRFMLLDVLDMVRIHSLRLYCSPDSQELRSVLQGLISEVIPSQKCHTVYVYMGLNCNGC